MRTFAKNKKGGCITAAALKSSRVVQPAPTQQRGSIADACFARDRVLCSGILARTIQKNDANVSSFSLKLRS
jgi:hypothetical protein